MIRQRLVVKGRSVAIVKAMGAQFDEEGQFWYVDNPRHMSEWEPWIPKARHPKTRNPSSMQEKTSQWEPPSAAMRAKTFLSAALLVHGQKVSENQLKKGWSKRAFELAVKKKKKLKLPTTEETGMSRARE